ncbi:hypothetical protein [Rhodococcus sp. ACT016]|uniref:hypothetical protein n=1 Tax=Rhodococcus sp. ACT016 TaxID=3134808 RepID=UPI003D2DC242
MSDGRSESFRRSLVTHLGFDAAVAPIPASCGRNVLTRAFVVDIVSPMKARDVGVVALAAGLAGAGVIYLHERPPKRPDAAQVAAEVTCLDPGMFPGHFPPPAPQTFTPPEPGVVPEGFDPVAVVTCAGGSGRTYFAADGQQPAGTTEVVEEVHREGDLRELLTALSEHSDPQGWWIEAWFGKTRRPPSGHCTPGTTCPLLWLVDRDGRAIRPSIPLTRSGASKAEAHYAIARLPIVGSVQHSLNVPASSGR